MKYKVDKYMFPFQVFLSTGTDEHGMKIQRAAEKEGVSPREISCFKDHDIRASSRILLAAELSSQ